MPRDIPVGNGSLLVVYDEHGIIRDITFPRVGMDNHVLGHAFRVGIWVDGFFRWSDHAAWERSLDYDDDTLVALISMTDRERAVEITFRDCVDFHENLFIREITARNLSAVPRNIRLFFHHDFHLSGTEIGDTACYKPEEKAVLHYKGRRYFLVNGRTDRVDGVHQFATGVKETERYRGTWFDAEDGVLSGNTVAQGSVDSTIALHLSVPPSGSVQGWYWMAAGEHWNEVKRLNSLVTERSPASFIKRTADYWSLWLGNERLDFDGLPETVARLYKRSLLVIRTNIDAGGAVIAANDSDILHFNRDTYSYLWPRDGALTAHALDLAGHPIPARNLFELCGEIMDRGGFFLHKYNADGSLASSWHPWVLDGKPSLPIQEDETGLVLWALWEHFRIYRDVEFIRPLYRKLIKACGDFLSSFIDGSTGLPLPSYDLWEERLGVHTFTACSVIAGLRAAAQFTEAFGETETAEKYRTAAHTMEGAVERHLYDRERGRYLAGMIRNTDGSLMKGMRLDASLFGLVLFGGFAPGDEKISATMRALKETLWCSNAIGGMARYEGDGYQAVVEPPTAEVPGNPWIISTLWYAQYLIAAAKNEQDLAAAVPLLSWVAERALPSGVLPEQVHPLTGEPWSVSPLTWSHAEFVITVHRYLTRLQDLTVSPTCGHPLFLKHPPGRA